VSRVELRDAFLELWGSDAPIIGCVGIDPRATPVEAERRSEPPSRRALPRAESAAPSPPPAPAARTFATATAVASAVGAADDLEGAPSYDAVAADAGESALVAALEREVRLGAVSDRARSNRRRSGHLLLGSVAAVTLVAVAAAAWFLLLESRPKGGSAIANDARPAGEESVLPAPVSPPSPAPESGPGTTTASPSTPVAGPGTAATPPASSVPTPTTAGNATLTAGLGVSGTPNLPGAPTVAAPRSGAPLTTAPPADGKKFRVHVASFRSEDKVAPIVRGLRLKGLDAWYEPAADGSGWYRVFVGRFATEDEAKAYASWLLQNKWVDRAHAFPSTSR